MQDFKDGQTKEGYLQVARLLKHRHNNS